MKNKNRLLYLLSVVMLTAVLLVSGCGSKSAKSADSAPPASSSAQVATANEGFSKFSGEPITIKMLDVGQGDALLIRTGSKTILIDTGDDRYREDSRKNQPNNQLFAALDKENVKTIDYFIMTHAHADHIGNAAKVIEKYDVKELVYNGIASTNSYFVKALKAAKEKGVKQHKVKAGDVLDFGSGATFKVLNPSAEMVKKDNEAVKNKEKVEPNNESVVGMLNYGDFKMLFTGDAEAPAEAEIIASYGKELKSNVLKVGHHGSKTSSSEDFLNAVKPSAGLMSMGEGNNYHHPHPSTLKKYKAHKIKVYRTDTMGTITVTTDGKKYGIEEEKQ